MIWLLWFGSSEFKVFELFGLAVIHRVSVGLKEAHSARNRYLGHLAGIKNPAGAGFQFNFCLKTSSLSFF
jgi:hypothetical protein